MYAKEGAVLLKQMTSGVFKGVKKPEKQNILLST